MSYGIAFGELKAYIEETRLNENVALVFKLADLTRFCAARLEHLGNDTGWVAFTALNSNLVSFHTFQISKHSKKDVMCSLTSTRILDMPSEKQARKTVKKHHFISSKQKKLFKRNCFK